LRGATITTSTCVVETCDPTGSCTTETSAQITLRFDETELWAALCIAAREAGVAVGLLLESYVGAGLSLAGYEVAGATRAVA
jgi:hypothetical protein